MDSLIASLSSDGFGHWLAGLIDGEGCFTITPNRPGFVCRLALSLRQDDAAVLEEIVSRVGLGHLIRAKTGGGNRRPQVQWRVQKKQECLVLCRVLDAFPLRAKKRNDYAVWREAVKLMNAMPPVGAGRPQEWSRIAALKLKLSEVRDGHDLRNGEVANSDAPGGASA